MVIKKANIILFMIMLLIVINLQILNFGDFSKIYRYLTSSISIILFSWCIFDKQIYYQIRLYNKFFSKWIIVFFLFLFLEVINGLLLGGKSITEAIGMTYVYNSWLLLFYPIIYILSTSKGLKKMSLIIVGLTTFTLILKTLVWWLYNYHGKDVMHYLLYEFGPEPWIREGFQRIPATCFSGILFSFTIYLFFYSKQWKIKLLALIVSLFNIWYANAIFASRAQLIVFFITIVVAVFSMKISMIKKFILNVIFIGLIILLTMLNMDTIDEFINSLSRETFSIGIRFIALDYYMDLFSDKWIMGINMMLNEDTLNGSSGLFYLSDLGILGDLFSWGVIGFFLMVIPFFRMIFILKNINNKKDRKYIFGISLIIYTILMSILSNDIYSFRNIFGLPFIIAYFEYWRVNNE
ncbi:hypothetical protein [Megamonas rupellensis]|uniref:hypothetical protein n=1 Tax=Megamonas rupellensis TaxID=491921 RepID=UPI0024202783|nr:hypothetical protein [Megamonas rupellensis]